MDSHLLLDGHDRLAAALAVGVEPRIITLWQADDVLVLTDTGVQEDFIKNYAGLFDNPNVPLAARQQLNHKLTAQHHKFKERAITVARANPVLDAVWNAEVRDVAPPANDPDEDVEPDVLDLLFDG